MQIEIRPRIYDSTFFVSLSGWVVGVSNIFLLSSLSPERKSSGLGVATSQNGSGTLGGRVVISPVSPEQRVNISENGVK